MAGFVLTVIPLATAAPQPRKLFPAADWVIVPFVCTGLSH
jgi:hypothetical protein